MNDILRKVLSRIAEYRDNYSAEILSEEEARILAALPSNETLDILSVAGAVRAVCAPAFFNCGIINARSGRCQENCAFCTQSGHYNTNVSVYSFASEETLLRKAEEACKAGAKRFGIVTSGTFLPEKDVDALCHAVERIIRCTGIGVCVSLGMLNAERALRYRQAGVTRYHHNLETAASYFPKICTTHAYEEDIATVNIARRAGMQVCSGGIIGLGESWDQRIEFAMTLADLDVDSIPVNFLNAIPGTPLESMPRLKPEEALRSIALFRMLNPSRDILIAGGRSHVLKEWQSWLYAAGANGMMIGNYLTTLGASFSEDHAMMHTLGVYDAQ